jgi:flagellar protein FliL
MAATTSDTHAPAAAAKKGPKKIMILVVAVASLGGGAAVPMVMGAGKSDGGEAKKKPEHPAINVPFGDVTVNLSEERGTRYLRLKIVLKLEGPHEEEEGVKLLAEFKPAMKTWLIAHLSGKAHKDVVGSVGVKRLRREIQEEFERILEDEEHGHGDKKLHLVLKDVLFEDYIVQ